MHALELIPGLNAILSREQNKLTGSFYTPPDVALDIVKKSISMWLTRLTGVNITDGRYDGLREHEKEAIIKALDRIRILDPSVGEAVFLLSAGEWILNTRLSLGDTTEPSIIREHILSNSLYGVDLQHKPIEQSTQALYSWALDEPSDFSHEMRVNLRVGNSLIGRIRKADVFPNMDKDTRECIRVFDWFKAFPEVFRQSNGFDVIIGNPPYGNLLSTAEKAILVGTTKHDVMSGRKGSWNAASLFIARTYSLLNKRGELGFLVPNSILRVGQFLKTRRFLLDPFSLWSITDEGNPFDDVTLEMVSIFCSVGDSLEVNVGIQSKRKGMMGSHCVPRSVFSSNKIYAIYHDETLSKIQSIGKIGVLRATRGRDIPIANIRRNPRGKYRVPYATKGRSINRYRFVEEHLRYADDWFLDDSALLESYHNELLVATKNFPYPRCIVKPKGMIHGGGIVKIIPLEDHYDIRAIGLILNSQLARYICIRYLTNYSQLTTCLNTGIITEFPIVYPEDPAPFMKLFDLLQHAHTLTKDSNDIYHLEAAADALVYSLYFPSNGELVGMYDALQKIRKDDLSTSIAILTEDDVQSEVHETLEQSIVREIRTSPRMN